MQFRDSITPTQLQAIVADLSSPEIDLKLRGLQKLCRHIEAGRQLVLPERLRTQILCLFFSPISKVRRWAYYCAEKLSLESSIEPLKYKVCNEEHDDECRMWAWSAFIALAPLTQVRELLNDKSFLYEGTCLEYIPLPKPLSNERRQLELIEREIVDDPIRARWAAIACGYENPVFEEGTSFELDRQLIRDLQLHEDVSVAEYAVWAFFNRSDGTAADLLISDHEIEKKSAGIRGWAYRLVLAKSDGSATEDFALDAISKELTKEEPAARKGLADALRFRYWDGIQNFILPWFEEEHSKPIRELLLSHIVNNSARCNDYREFLLGLIGDPVAARQYEGALRNLFSKDITQYQEFAKLLAKGEKTTVEVIMNKYDFGGVGSISGGVVNFGEVKGSILSHINDVDSNHPLASVREEIERLFSELEKDNQLSMEMKDDVAEALQDLAKADVKERPNLAKRALAVLKGTAEATANTSKIAESVEKLGLVLEKLT